MNDAIPMIRTLRGMQSLSAWRPMLCLSLVLSSALQADELTLKNGQTIEGKTFVRQGESLFLTETLTGEPVTLETGIPLAAITRISCDPPAVLASAPALLAKGDCQKVLEEVDAALKEAEKFGTLPGSRWPDLLVLRSHILVAMGKDADAAAMAASMSRTKDPRLVCNSEVLLALLAARKGSHTEAAARLKDALVGESSGNGAVAASSVARGLGLLEKEMYPDAMKAFLELPVFLPDETALIGMVQLGTARAYFGLNDTDTAIATLEDLIKNRPGTPEVAIAESLLPEWKRRRTAIQEAKEP